MPESNWALERAREVSQWASEYTGDHRFGDHMREGILYALTAQAESLHSIGYGPGQDTVTVRVTGDNREQILMAAFFEARQFFGPGRELEVYEPWNAEPNPFWHEADDPARKRTAGRRIATVLLKEKADDQE